MPKTQVPSTTAEQLVEMIPALRIYARNLTPGWVEADALVQETLTKALADAGNVRTGTNLRLWLFRIMRNAVLAKGAHRSGAAEGRAGRVIGFPGRDAPGAANPTRKRH